MIEIKEYVGNIYISYGFFIIGLLLNTIVTLIGKKTIGRLRPNFLDVCKPNVNPYSACGEVHLTGKYICPNTRETLILSSKIKIPTIRPWRNARQKVHSKFTKKYFINLNVPLVIIKLWILYVNIKEKSPN